MKSKLIGRAPCIIYARVLIFLGLELLIQHQGWLLLAVHQVSTGSLGDRGNVHTPPTCILGPRCVFWACLISPVRGAHLYVAEVSITNCHDLLVASRSQRVPLDPFLRDN